MPNFTACAAKFLNNTELYKSYIYTGPTNNVFNNIHSISDPVLISVEGCRNLCGTGSDYYRWDQASNTISTWILPIIGLILQAPFDSNEFRKTVLALARWLGSPIVSLSYIFWNIRVTGTCASLVDMVTRFDTIPPYNEMNPSQFEQLRDSFYIMSVMNQFTFRKSLPDKTGEKLLRAALFRDEYNDPGAGHGNNLARKRRKLATSLRELRKKGIVPVFISLIWFIFSLTISIQAAWGQLGSNATAHDLALGLLTAWLPTLILACIVDRNPAATGPVKTKLNKFVAQTRSILLERDAQSVARGMADPHLTWTGVMRENEPDWNSFFVDFAGQGRIRWHYGIAQPIIVGIEEAFALDKGREWLEGHDARQRLVDGPFDDKGSSIMKGLHFYDKAEILQLFTAFLVVFTAVAGAFIISFFTPTVGLSCRSGGYMIFFIIAFALFLLEYSTWWFTHDKDAAIGEEYLTENRSSPKSRTSTFNIRTFMQNFVLRPLEAANTVWLSYIVTAQTFGSYQTCDCMSSNWGASPGYIDFRTYAYFDNHQIYELWANATALSIVTMFIAFIYIVWQWCEQSHMCSSDYAKARRGLFRTRWIKYHTIWMRLLWPTEVAAAVKMWCSAIRIRRSDNDRRGARMQMTMSDNKKERRRSSLVWMKKARGESNNSFSDMGGRGRYEHLKDGSVSVSGGVVTSSSPPLDARNTRRGPTTTNEMMSPYMDRAALLPRYPYSSASPYEEGSPEMVGGSGDAGGAGGDGFGSSSYFPTPYLGMQTSAGGQRGRQGGWGAAWGGGAGVGASATGDGEGAGGSAEHLRSYSAGNVSTRSFA